MDEKRLFKKIIIIAEMLLTHGAEIYRVEESVIRMVKAYGYNDVEIFAIPSFFTMTVMTDNGNFTVSRRSRNNRINLDCLHELNNLVRYISDNAPDADYIEEEICKIKSYKANQKLVLLGYGVTAGFFSIFFGGWIKEAIAGFIIGLIIYFTLYLFEILKVNNIVMTLLSSGVLAFFAVTFYRLGLITNLDSTVIGSLMVLVPGVAITNSLRDLIGSEYISGLARITEAFLIAIAIAIGVGVVFIIMGV